MVRMSEWERAYCILVLLWSWGKLLIEFSSSVILLKQCSRCHVMPPHSLSMARNFYVNQRK
jgi:hypothetical protein